MTYPTIGTTTKSGATNLNDVGDVNLTSPTDDEVLAYDNASGEWINQTPAEAGLAAASHTHSTSDITSGTFADARIAQSNVTQHQGALTITESQISDLQSYLLNVVEDTTPQLGGTLDANGNTIDMGVNIITDTKVGQWDTAYGWGDHSSAGYLTAITGESIEDLSDVQNTAYNNDNILSYSSGTWIKKYTISDSSTSTTDLWTSDKINTELGNKANTSVSINGGSGLSGGGNLTSSRTLNLDVNSLSVISSVIGSTDYLAIYDASTASMKKVLVDNLGVGGGADAINDLTDVNITSVTDGEFLVYDSGNWINKTRAQALLDITKTVNVDSAGSIIAQSDAGFFTVTKNGTGDYRCTHNLGHGQFSFNVISTNGGTATIVTATGTTSWIDVKTWNASGSATDSGFELQLFQW